MSRSYSELMIDYENDYDPEQKRYFFATIKDSPEQFPGSSSSFHKIQPSLQNQEKTQINIKEQTDPLFKRSRKLIKKAKHQKKLHSQNKDQQFSLKQRHRTKKVKNNRKDYSKNICTYISNHILQQFLAHHNDQCIQIIKKISEHLQIERQGFLKYYSLKRRDIRGICTLRQNIHSQHHLLDNLENVYKLGFSIFFVWYLRYFYLGYLMSEGKMKCPEIYIEYKNRYLLTLFDTTVYEKFSLLSKQRNSSQ